MWNSIMEASFFGHTIVIVFPEFRPVAGNVLSAGMQDELQPGGKVRGEGVRISWFGV
jgi:hypothetical protein